jgi:pimeloyl-ACP methyl ester carboxylesterase
MPDPNEGFRFETIAANGMALHCAMAGEASKPLMLFLHGFPEFWVGWRAVMRRFADTHWCVAPDQRGYNLSSKPDGVENYAVGHLVTDIHALVDQLSPEAPFLLCGHDWGASIAYTCAMRYADRLTGLVIANGVHPVPFQRALVEDPDQIAASQYIHKLRSPEAEAMLSGEDYGLLQGMIAKFSHAPFFTPELAAEYVAAWSRPGALTAMLNWYRATPIYVPMGDETPDPAKAVSLPPELVRVRVPHLLLHGLEDEALRPSAFEGLDAFCDDLEVARLDGTGHWLLHERPQEVSELIRDWIGRKL